MIEQSVKIYYFIAICLFVFLFIFLGILDIVVLGVGRV